MTRRGFATPFSIAERCVGPADFWSDVAAMKAKIPPPRDHYNWDEWDQFWAIAQRHGMMDYVPNDDGTAKTFRFGAVGIGLVRQFLRVKKAREDGIDAYQFHLRERKAIEAEERARNAEVERQRRERIERTAREEEHRKNKGYATRTFRPRRPQDDEEIAI